MKPYCDEAMKRSKERASHYSWKEKGIPQWRCTGDCDRRICYVIQGLHGAKEHVNRGYRS